MTSLAIEPNIAGGCHEFRFEGRDVTIALPPLPEADVPNGSGRRSAYDSSAVIFMWNAKKEPIGIEIGTVKLAISDFEVEIPESAANYPSINSSLYNKKQLEELDAFSDALHNLADRAITYWLRVLWWKTSWHMVARRSVINNSGNFGGSLLHGGALLNTKTGTRFYSPRISRTARVPFMPIMKLSTWLEIDTALKAGLEPPIWHEYLISAQQRLDNGDNIASILDLAIAAESLIRNTLDNLLPVDLPHGFRKSMQRLNISDVLARWQKFGLPPLETLDCIRTLFDIRNKLMHRGSDDRANTDFCKSASSAVSILIDTIHTSK